jgi:hypothetical protein
MSILLKKALDLFGKRTKPEDMVGQEGEVTTTIGKGAIGAVTLGNKTFEARANDLNIELLKGDKIHVIRAGASVLYVAKGRKPIKVHVEIAPSKPSQAHNHGNGGGGGGCGNGGGGGGCGCSH